MPFPIAAKLAAAWLPYCWPSFVEPESIRLARIDYFDFDIPADATITGIEVQIRRRALSGVGIGDYDLRTIYGSTLGASDLAARARDAGFDLAFRRGFLRAPPPETIFLHRKLAGTFLLCCRIRARADTHELVLPYLDRAESVAALADRDAALAALRDQVVNLAESLATARAETGGLAEGRQTAEAEAGRLRGELAALQALRREIERLGLAGVTVTVRARGETELPEATDDEEPSEENRRVEVTLQ